MAQASTQWPFGDGEMARRIRAFDWASTPLGPIARWPQSLKTIVDLMLVSRSMMSLVWGPEAIHLYNDSFTELLREHRHLSLGRSAYATFAWSREVFEVDIAAGMAGKSARLMGRLYPVLKQGRLQDAWFDVDYAPVRNEAGVIAGVLSTLSESTAQVLTEQALRARETRHRLLIESWAQAEWETDAAGAVVADSPSWRAYTGQTLEEWLGDGWLDAIHPEERADAEQEWREAIATHRAIDAEFRLRSPGDNWRWTNVRAAPVLDEAGEIQRWIGTNIDVTARKRAEAALRERETDLARVQRIGGVGGINIDVAGGMRSWRSPEYLRLHGLPEGTTEESHEDWLARVHPEDRAKAEKTLSEALGSGTSVYESEYRIVRFSDGETRWIYVRADIERDGNGKAARLVGAHLDLTARKRVEAALRESEELRRIALEGGRMGTWRWDLRDKLIWGDAMFLGLWGFPPSSEPRSLADFTDRMTPQGQAEMGEMITRAIAAGEAFDSQLAIVGGPTGGCWVRWRGQAEAERPHIVNGVSFDVTDQRVAEERLRESERTLAEDLVDAERLRSLSERLVPEQSFQAICDEVLSATVAITRADAGTIQIYDPAAKALEMIASLNFSRTITDYFHRVDAGSRTACGIALKTGERAFVDFPDEDADLGCQLLAGEGIQSALAFPLLSRSGAPLGMLNAHWRQARHRSNARDLRFLDLLARQAADLIERRQRERALRESEERFQQFSEATPDILWSRDAETMQWDYISPAFEEIYGSSREKVLEGNNLRRWLEMIEPDDRREVLGCMRRVRDGERVTFEFRIRRAADGQVRWLRNTVFPIRDQIGRVHRIGGIGHDITELKTTEAALTHSEHRLRTLVEGVPQLVWRAINHGDWTWASPQWVAFTGQREPDSHRFGWLDPIHPDDRELARSAWDQAVETGGFEVEYRIRNAAQDAYRWFQTRATPVRDAAGKITEWLGTSTDIHDLRDMQDRQKVLVAELQHRTRNLMGVVRASTESILRASTDLADFGERYRDRLSALARVQGLLSRLEGVERITFDELIQSEIKAMGAIDGSLGKVVLNGPAGVALRSSTVQTFALALHELATNAVKYGALASPSGRLTVTWQLEFDTEREGMPWLHVNWHETGVAMPSADAPPQGSGQGRKLIERALPYQLGAKTTYVMGADGVRCSIAVPVSSRTAVTEIDDGDQPAS